jgi:hypothetical protein
MDCPAAICIGCDVIGLTLIDVLLDIVGYSRFRVMAV